ncbi:hypothetical protein ABNF97_05890 [Plantactinospora sp. B6F1]|uniref:hypothetical protein n=1 Tax=Plantactinospora sp. B6F1 TaxID=3158971 RepID=UPI0032D94A1F
MAFWRVRDRIRLEAGHVLDVASGGDGFGIQYCETALTAKRPMRGKAEQRIRCGHCGHVIVFTVYSAALTRRHRFVAYGLGAALLAVAVLVYGIGIDAVVSATGPLWPLLLAVSEIALIVLALGFLGYAAMFEYGVRSPRMWRGGPAPRYSHLAMFDPHLGNKPLARTGRASSTIHHQHTDDRPPGSGST